MSASVEPKQNRGLILDATDTWIAGSAWCVAVGWSLSLLHSLTWTGYIAAIVLTIVIGIALKHRVAFAFSSRLWRFHWKAPVAPRIWLFLALLALAGGMFYSPCNYDYLTYRFPRVLYWSGEHHWFWITTADGRMNLSATGMEWLMTPLYVLFRTDRLFFIANFIPFLLLPGLVFSVFRRLGIHRRIAWWWMWILPCGYCYVLQAASMGNDSFAAIYGLASLLYALKLRTECSAKNVAFSLIATGLLTGAKLSNLPLILPTGAALLSSVDCIKSHLRSWPVYGSIILAAVISCLPIILFNLKFTGDYSGDPHNASAMRIANPVVGICGNALQLTADNFSPPIWPREISWNPHLPETVRTWLKQGFPRLDLHFGELQIEEQAGVGLGIVAVLAVTVIVALLAKGPRRIRRDYALWIAGATAVAFLAFMAKMGSESTSRLLAAYYPPAIAAVLVLVGPGEGLTRGTLFRWVSIAAMLSSIPLLILNPAQPLFPARLFSREIVQHFPASNGLKRAVQVYTTYAERPDAFRDLRNLIPPGQNVFGVIALGDDPIASLWRPFGSHQIVEMTSSLPADEIRAQGINYVLVSEAGLASNSGLTIDALRSAWSARLVAEKELTLKVKRGPEKWFLLEL